jgi:hypothetical protein
MPREPRCAPSATAARALALAAGTALLFASGCGPTVPGARQSIAAPTAAAPVPSIEQHSAASDAQVAAGVPAFSPATSACDGHAAENLALGGVATASDAGDDALEGPAAAFDDNTGTRWAARASRTPWLGYELAGGVPQVVTQYALSVASDGDGSLDPVAFKLEGSNGDDVWVLLHERQHQDYLNREMLMWYRFENTRPFSRYRLSIRENGGGTGIQVAELELFGPGSPVFSVDNSAKGGGLNQFTYSPGWTLGLKDTEVKEWKFGRSSSWSRARDSIATFSFSGSQIALYGVRHAHHGIAAISIDQEPETLVDFYGATAGNTLFYTSPRLCPPALHVLRVRVTGDKRAEAGDTFISLDRVKVTP